MQGYWTIVDAKPSQLVGETLCSLPINGANCCYPDCLNLWASTVQCKLAKGQSDDGGTTASPMTKSAKDDELEEESFPS